MIVTPLSLINERHANMFLSSTVWSNCMWKGGIVDRKYEFLKSRLNVFFNFFQLAKAEKLKPLEVELKKLEDLSESIVNDFAYMRSREEEMRDTNGK